MGTSLISYMKDQKVLDTNLKFVTTSLVERHLFTAVFKNMRTLKFKSQPTNAFFSTVNQMFASDHVV